MYTMELSGVHIGRKVNLTYVFGRSPAAYKKSGYLGEIRHMGRGELWLILVNDKDSVPRSRQIGGAFRVPYNGEVEFLD
jgi:hypothetical protein